MITSRVDLEPNQIALHTFTTFIHLANTVALKSVSFTSTLDFDHGVARVKIAIPYWAVLFSKRALLSLPERMAAQFLYKHPRRSFKLAQRTLYNLVSNSRVAGLTLSVDWHGCYVSLRLHLQLPPLFKTYHNDVPFGSIDNALASLPFGCRVAGGHVHVCLCRC